MSGVWSKPPASRVASLSDLGSQGEKVSEGAGESLFVCELRRHPGWLYKAYRAPTSAESAARLDKLIGLPAAMTVKDRSVVDGHTSWPAVRVVDAANRTTGVLLPMAPRAYQHEMSLPGGRSTKKYLEVDVLALSETRQQQMGLPPQSLADRISICRSIVATADLLERHDLVYLDWSYANVFWRPVGHSAYLIDLDGISFGPRPQIHSPQWEDPHVPLGTTAGKPSDRYRVALLITSCLTGKRVYEAEARTELGELRKMSAEIEQLAELLIMALTSAAAARPTIARIKAALDAVPHASAASAPRYGQGSGAAVTPDRGGVKDWKPIGNRGSTQATPSVTVPPTAKPAPQKPPVTVASSASTPSSPQTGATAGSSTAGSAAGGGVMNNTQWARPQQNTQSQTPVRQPSGGLPAALKVTLWIIAIIVIIAILANA
ncbi:MAG: hypothetical protein ABSA02_05945 [Trebonia sp.]